MIYTAAAIATLLAAAPAAQAAVDNWSYFTENHGGSTGDDNTGQQIGGGGGNPAPPSGDNWDPNQGAGQTVRESLSVGGGGNGGGNGGNGGGNNGQQDRPAPASQGSTSGGSHSGHGTWYEAIGIPISACGVPANQYQEASGKSFPFGALNTNAMFENGKHCGRWTEVTLGQNCYHSAHSQYGVCDTDPQGRWVDDEDTGKVIYVYIADMCPDDNFWCQMDPGHIDISAPFLSEKGLKNNWNGRKISWSFMDGPPGQYNTKPMKFMWKSGSKFQPGNSSAGFFLSLVVVNTPNGISRVEQQMGNGWADAKQLNELGQQYVLTQDHGSSGTFKIRVYDYDGNMYGTYNVEFNAHQAGNYVDAPFSNA